LLALLIEHRGLTVRAAAPLLDLPHFKVLRFANRLVRLGYATRAGGTYFTTISGREINAVMQGRLR
jgi:DNA-binding IclR family transcriptional regulator